jgi:hypothetical protein
MGKLPIVKLIDLGWTTLYVWEGQRMMSHRKHGFHSFEEACEIEKIPLRS